MKKLLLVLAFIAVFGAGYAARTVISSLCGGASCDRHAAMDCCKQDGSCDRHAKEGCCKKDGSCDRSAMKGDCCKKHGKPDSTEITLGDSGETKACCKKKHD